MTEDHSLAAAVAEACRATGLLAPGDRVLVAVSGGVDSTALALLLAEAAYNDLPLALVLGHVDHGWRGPAEAAADRAVVQDLGRRLDLRVCLLPAPAESHRTEDAARRHRYRSLAAAAVREGCSTVATGHHLRDQAETVLMRMERGSGRVGLRGIPVRRPLGEQGLEVVRPLLGVHPRDLRAHVAARGVPWRDDVTNDDLSRDRARARRRIEAVEARGGSASRRLAEFARRLGRRIERDETRVADLLDENLALYPEADAVEAPRDTLAALSPSLLDLALRRLGASIRAERDGPFFTRRHLALVGLLLSDGGALDLPRGLLFEVSGRRAWLRRRDPKPHARAALERADVAAHAFDLDRFLQSRAPTQAAVDAAPLGDAPHLRGIEDADRFVPWGRGAARSVNVLAWLARRQVPSWLRRRLLVVEGDTGIAWVPGHRIDAAHAVGPHTTRVARLRVAWPGWIRRRRIRRGPGARPAWSLRPSPSSRSCPSRRLPDPRRAR